MQQLLHIQRKILGQDSVKETRADYADVGHALFLSSEPVVEQETGAEVLFQDRQD